MRFKLSISPRAKANVRVRIGQGDGCNSPPLVYNLISSIHSGILTGTNVKVKEALFFLLTLVNFSAETVMDLGYSLVQ